MKIVILLLALCAICALARDVNSGRFPRRYINSRLNPVSGRSPRRFRPRLFNLSGSAGRRRVFIRRQRPSTSNKLGPVAALRAGQEGAFDFSDQYNAIIPDKNAGKPTKQPPTTTTTDANKINIESKIPADTTNDSVVEKVHTKGTAILHCAFDNVEQIGTYKQAKIWWTKLPEREFERPVIVAAGTQIRLPDDRLRVITFPDNTFSILVIRDALPEDAGQYKCSLPTVTGTKTSFTSLQVLEAKSDMVAMSAKETTLNAGDNLHLFCRPDDKSLSVWWTAKDKEGNNIVIVQGHDRVAGKTLNVPNVQRSQAGIYTCHIENRFGSPNRRHFTVQVKEKPWDIDAFIGGFQMNTLLAKFYKDPVYGDNVNLRCDTGGVPIPTVQWYKDGRLLSDSYKYVITSFKPSYKENSVVAKLTINGFQSYDEGTYSCRAVNDAGTKQQDFNIQGQSSPLISSDDEDYARAALRGRRGRIIVKTCKGGGKCTIEDNSEGSGGYDRE